MLSIEPFGGVANVNSGNLSSVISDVQHLGTEDYVGGICSDIERGVSDLNDAEGSLSEASDHIETLEDVIATLLGVIENVREICNDQEESCIKDDVLDATDLADCHPLALRQEVYLGGIINNRESDPLGMLKEYIPKMTNHPHGHKLIKGGLCVRYSFEKWMGNTIDTITHENLTFYKVFVKDHTTNKRVYYREHFENPSKPTDAECSLWTLETGLKYLPEILLKEIQNELSKV